MSKNTRIFVSESLGNTLCVSGGGTPRPLSLSSCLLKSFHVPVVAPQVSLVREKKSELNSIRWGGGGGG